jgi:ankyrin repeat protein
VEKVDSVSCTHDAHSASTLFCVAQDDVTPLHVAALKGHVEVATLLVIRGAVVNATAKVSDGATVVCGGVGRVTRSGKG